MAGHDIMMGDFICSRNLVFQFFSFSDPLRVPELIIKGVEGLNLVSEEELFIDTVNRTVAAAERLALNNSARSCTRGPETVVSSLIRSHSYFLKVSSKDKRN